MKYIQFFAKDIDNKSIKIDAPLGVEIVFNDKRYKISESNTGEMLLYSTEKLQLILKTKSGNVVEIDSSN